MGYNDPADDELDAAFAGLGLTGHEARVRSALVRRSPVSASWILRDELVWREDWAFVHEAPWRVEVGWLEARTGLQTRLLVNASALELGKAQGYARRRATQVRYLPEEIYFERYACYILGDVVSLLSFDESVLTGPGIANRGFARGFRARFEALWRSAHP